MATDFSIDKFTSKLSQGGALASLFKAEMNRAKGQASGAVSESFGFLCKASNFPTSSIDVTEINYMGRPIRIPGNRAAQDWTTTVYNDEDFKIRSGLENWMEQISSHAFNKRQSGMIGINSYTGELTIEQLAKAGGEAGKEYKFMDCWPYTLAEITVDWDTNEIQTYDVTWAFSYWTSSQSGISPGGGGSSTPSPHT